MTKIVELALTHPISFFAICGFTGMLGAAFVVWVYDYEYDIRMWWNGRYVG